MFVGKVFFKDGEWLKTNQFVAHEHAVVYEVIRLVKGVPLFWDAHFQRLRHSFKLLNIAFSLNHSSLHKTVSKLVNINALPDSNLRINIHYNKALKHIECVEIGQVSVILPHPKYYETGVKSCILEVERPNPNIKNIHLDVRKKVSNKIAEKLVWDVVLQNHAGELTEGGRSNLFFIKNNAIYTPPVTQVLPGITRSMVIKACLLLKIPVYENSIKEQELKNFEASFFTGTTPGILPIASIDHYPFNVHLPLMQQLSEFYRRMVHEDISGNHDFL